MAIIGDALRQAFMPKREYENLRDEEKAWGRLQRPMLTFFVVIVWIAVLVSAFVSLTIVFPSKAGNRLLCHSADRRVQELLGNAAHDSDPFRGSFYLTENQVANYYWMVVFVPSAIVFFASVVYLLAGIAVAYAAPSRHGCLRVVENNYCASKRGGVRCLSILNTTVAIIFALLAMFLGSSLLTLRNSCSSALFWCYEITAWGLVILYGGTAFFLRRKAAVILDEADYTGRNLGLEMLEASHEVSPHMERRVNEGFRSWMGSSLISSDEEDGPDDYPDEAYSIGINSNQQRA